jgi:hypothetical protein
MWMTSHARIAMKFGEIYTDLDFDHFNKPVSFSCDKMFDVYATGMDKKKIHWNFIKLVPVHKQTTYI